MAYGPRRPSYTWKGWKDTHELAWAAGFVDGDGHFGWSSGKHVGLKISISQTDRQVLDRFQAAVGLGKVVGPVTRSTTTYRRPMTVYTYRAARFEEVQAIVCMIWPWLSPVKRDQIKALFSAWRTNRYASNKA